MNVPKNDGCNALVPVERRVDAPRPHSRTARPDASFVAHLIAVASSTPQTRMLRRASPADALNGYRVAAKHRTALSIENGVRLSRVA